MLYWIALQDFVGAFLYRVGMPSIMLRMLILSKEIVVVFLFIISLATMYARKHFDVSHIVGVAFISFVVIFSIYGNAPINSKLSSIRIYSLPVMLSCIGYSCINTFTTYSKYIKHVVMVSLIVAIFGLIEYIFLPVSFWTEIVPIFSFNQVVKYGNEDISESLEYFGNFYGDYGTGYMSLRRLISLFGSPLTTGYFIFFSFIIYFVLVVDADESRKYGLSQNNKYILLFLLIGCMIFTFTRGVLLPVIGLLVYHYGMKHKSILTFGTIIIIPAIWSIIDIDIIFQNLFQDASATGHLIELLQGINAFIDKPLGGGLGTAGAWAIRFNEDAIGTESSILSLGIQLGIPGIIIFFTFWWYLVKKRFIEILGLNYKYRQQQYRLLVYSTLGYLFTAIISEQLFTFTSVAAYWLYLGAELRENKSNNI